MAINIADNFAYNGKKPMDNRTEYATLSAMKAVVDANINEGCMCYNKEDGKYYTFKSTNTVDATTGKWREFETGGGGETYSDFTGATASMAGAHGLVPAPSAGDESKVLFGNGTWGNIVMPSVDYSVLSNEAFVFSATEKVIGQWTDGKLLYAKTVDCGTMPNNEKKYVPHGISNLDKVVYITGAGLISTANAFYVLPTLNLTNLSGCINVEVDDTNIIIYTWMDRTNFGGGHVTLFYTKTTDSPLASDEKFAGLLSSGTVVYKKTVSTGGSAPSGTTLIYRLALLNSTDVVYFTR